MEKTTDSVPLSHRSESKSSPRPGDAQSKHVHGMDSARSQAKSLASSRQDGPEHMGSARSGAASARSGAAPETFRTSMSTARVHTALAALSAEKQALMNRLQMIDAALEGENKKKATKPRSKN